MPAYKIKHITRYTYASTVIDCTNQIMLYPISDIHLEVKKHEINISHNPGIEIFADYFGNQIGVFSVIKPHTELLIESISEVVTKPIIFPIDEEAPERQWQHLRDLRNQTGFMDFLTEETFATHDDLKKLMSSHIDYSNTPLKNTLILSEYVYDNFKYKKGVTNTETPPEEIWKLKAGVCQDFAHILLVFLRMFGIPARYVSGYICPSESGVRGEGATHAWVEAYIPFYGWLGIDPTNNCVVSDGHVRVAIGRNFTDCTPVKGTYKGSGDHTLDVTVNIENGELKTSHEPAKSGLPKFIYSVKNPTVPQNSYRRFLDMQKQQQQQQQQ